MAWDVTGIAITDEVFVEWDGRVEELIALQPPSSRYNLLTISDPYLRDIISVHRLHTAVETESCCERNAAQQDPRPSKTGPKAVFCSFALRMRDEWVASSREYKHRYGGTVCVCVRCLCLPSILGASLHHSLHTPGVFQIQHGSTKYPKFCYTG